MNIGERIKRLRKEKGFSQAELGEKVGLGDRAISSFETERNSPSNEIIVKFSEIFGVTTDYLLTGKEGTSEINEEEREVLEFMRKDVDFKKAVTQAASFKKKAINFLVSYQPQQAHAA